MARKVFLFALFPALLAAGFLLLRGAQAQTPTPAPTDVTATPISACAFNFTFKAPVDISAYNYQISKDPSFNNVDMLWYPASETAVDAKAGDTITVAPQPNAQTYGYEGYNGLPAQSLFFTPSTTYYFRADIYPANGNQVSGFSPSISQTTNAMPAPGAPQGVTGAWNDGAGRIDVAWSAGSQPANFDTYGGFEVYRAVSTNGGVSYSAFALVGTLPASSGQRSYSDIDVKSVNSYEYYVRAYDSDAGCVTTGIPDLQIAYSPNSTPTVVIPTAPSDLRVTGTSLHLSGVPQIDLAWTDNAKGPGQEDLFEIVRTFGGVTKTITVNKGITNYQDTDLQQKGAYTYAIHACKNNNTWCSAFTPAISVTAPSDSITLTSALESVSANYTAYVRHTWGPPTAQDSVLSFTRTSASGASVDVACTPWSKDSSGNQTCVEHDVPTGTSYAYAITVRRKLGVGSYKKLSASSNADLNIKAVFTGEGWSAYTNQATGGNAGISWVSLSGTGNDPDHTPYSVWADGTGLLHGAAWASITLPTTPPKESYGWLSFRDEGKGVSQLDTTTGVVSGWAKFINADGSATGGWDGWVKLRSDPSDTVQYGTCFGLSKGADAQVGADRYYTGADCAHDGGTTVNGIANFSKLTGLAWAGQDIGGWVMWNPADNKSAEPPRPPVTITPPGPLSLAYFERKSFSASDPAKWYTGPHSGTGLVWGGNPDFGPIAPKTTDPAGPDVNAIYTAPPTHLQFLIVASSTKQDSQASVDVTATPPYTLSCAPTLDGTGINVAWTANFTDPNYTTYASHRLALERNGTMAICGSETAKQGSGSCTENGLSPNTAYSYKLSAQYIGSSFIYTTPPISCTTGSGNPPTSDAPSRTGVYANSADTIYVNWKDNTTTTAPYSFEIQRIKVTPEENIAAAITNSTASQITLTWQNATLSTPYTNYYERSSLAGGGTRFDAGTDPSLVTGSVGGNSDPNLPVPISYTLHDPVDEATTYYYRLRSCSSINGGDLSPFYTPASAIKAGSVATPALVCSPYTATDASGEALATTTPPFAPSNLTASVTSPSQVTLTWTDNSMKESGFTIYQNGARVQDVPSNPGAGAVSVTLSGLSPGAYSYRVSAYYTVPNTYGGATVYSTLSNTAGVTIAFAGGGNKSFLASIGDVLRSTWRIFFEGPSSRANAGATESAWNAIKDGFGAFLDGATTRLSGIQSLGGQLGSYVADHTPRAEGASVLDQYFAKFDKTVYVPVYVDTGLSPDSVYLYRVRTVYATGKTTAWDSLGAIKTLRDANGGTVGARPVCTRNSYCNFSIQGVQSLSSPIESSLEQCTTNADCRDVGRAGQSYQEK